MMNDRTSTTADIAFETTRFDIEQEVSSIMIQSIQSNSFTCMTTTDIAGLGIENEEVLQTNAPSVPATNSHSHGSIEALGLRAANLQGSDFLRLERPPVLVVKTRPQKKDFVAKSDELGIHEVERRWGQRQPVHPMEFTVSSTGCG